MKKARKPKAKPRKAKTKTKRASTRDLLDAINILLEALSAHEVIASRLLAEMQDKQPAQAAGAAITAAAQRSTTAAPQPQPGVIEDPPFMGVKRDATR